MSGFLDSIGNGASLFSMFNQLPQTFGNQCAQYFPQQPVIYPCPHATICAACRAEQEQGQLIRRQAEGVAVIAACYDRAHYENRCRDFMTQWRQGRPTPHGAGCLRQTNL